MKVPAKVCSEDGELTIQMKKERVPSTKTQFLSSLSLTAFDETPCITMGKELEEYGNVFIMGIVIDYFIDIWETSI